ncbi:hypothetical protein [Roseomonas genomospecies 6]|uniref:Uncharacterized protein n=1 Tax=Roseomonas genomospecies 6 TaxID=214106 RepID=A0A9W7KR77_9PROT|nr:hypothetical protein [Roseomonas genomospecies 6]KAA0678109.1 hypothetical protein DS843_21235 [Roseomonas genomospecies 6]
MTATPRKGRQDLRAEVWATIRRLKRFTVPDLLAAGMSRPTCKSFIPLLVDNGILSREEVPGRRGFVDGMVQRYELVRDLGRRCPRFTANGQLDETPTTTERIWAAIKPLPAFSIPEIAMLARVARPTTAKYINTLYRAGYLDELSPGGGYYRQAKYRLRRKRSTGPQPPVICKDGSVWDANEGKQVLAPRAETKAEAPALAEVAA